MRRYLAMFPLILAPLSIACSDGDKEDEEEEEEEGFEENGEETTGEENTEEEEEEESQEIELLFYYGWSSSITVDAEASTGSGSETFWYYEPDVYADDICTTVREATATEASYACPNCDFALAVDLADSVLGVDQTAGSGESFCDLLGVEAGGDAFVRDGIGHASYYVNGSSGAGYYDVMVYYFTDYGAWYPIAYSSFDGSQWDYTYTSASWYYYLYYEL